MYIIKTTQMHKPFKHKRLLISTVLIALMLCGTAYALLSWTHTIEITFSNLNFKVYKEDQVTEWNSGETTTVPDPGSITKVFWIQNNGDVAINVTGTVTFTKGSATVVWNPTSGILNLPLSGFNNITLTLSGFTEATTAVITFTSKKA